MSTYSSLLKSSDAFEKLFKTLSKILLGLTVVFIVLGVILIKHFTRYFPSGLMEHYAAILYFMAPAIITLVLSIATFVAAKCAYHVRFELPVDKDTN